VSSGRVNRLSVNIATQRIDEPIVVTSSVVCEIFESIIIRFAEKNLIWDGETNKEEVILYNTLIATGDWKLEEVTIEELL
jgi:hypothetical protein